MLLCNANTSKDSNLSPTAEDILVPTVISRDHHLTLLTVIVDFTMTVAILAMLKSLCD